MDIEANRLLAQLCYSMARMKQAARIGPNLGHGRWATFPHVKLPKIATSGHGQRLGPASDPKVPIAVRLVRENAALRSKASNVTPQGFYKAQKGPTKGGKK